MREPLESLAILNNTVVPCVMEGECKNSPSNCIRPKCTECRLSPGMVLAGLPDHQWRPVGKAKHPTLESEKRNAKRQKAIARQKARQAKDRTKQARSRAAERAERKTNAGIIKATRNSGRLNRDGDHVFNNNFVLDTKLQSNAENPTVNLHELDKVRADAKRNGYPSGGLVLTNRSGRKVIVIDQRDVGYLVTGTIVSMDSDEEPPVRTS